MPALRYYYSDTISRFLTKNTEEIIGKLTLASQHDIMMRRQTHGLRKLKL